MSSTKREVVTLGGGCFWCLDAVFTDIRGVEQVLSGYSGGRGPNPTYEEVCTGGTGHAEVVQITFDPAVVSLRELLHVFFTLHDPTTKDRQGNDVGTQYRSIILYRDEEQKAAAEDAIREIDDVGRVGRQGGHRAQALRGVLSGGGLPSGLLQEEPPPALLPLRHPSQGLQAEEEVPADAKGLLSPQGPFYRPGSALPVCEG